MKVSDEEQIQTYHHNRLQRLNIWFLGVEQLDNNMCSSILKIELEIKLRAKKMMRIIKANI